MALKKPQLKNIELISAIAHLYTNLQSDREKIFEMYVVGDITSLKCQDQNHWLTFQMRGMEIEIKTLDNSGRLLQTATGNLRDLPAVEDHIIKTFDL